MGPYCCRSDRASGLWLGRVAWPMGKRNALVALRPFRISHKAGLRSQSLEPASRTGSYLIELGCRRSCCCAMSVSKIEMETSSRLQRFLMVPCCLCVCVMLLHVKISGAINLQYVRLASEPTSSMQTRIGLNRIELN